MLVPQDADTSDTLLNVSTPKEIAFFDTALSNLQTLIDGLQPDVSVYLLDNTSDALGQIATVLAGYRDLAAVKIFSHGGDGALQLGGQTIDADALTGAAGVLQSWKGSLRAGADLLLFGCNLAATEIGQAFVQQFASLTGADVAASTDLTGHSALGGNWDLEYATGRIETTGVLTDWAKVGYGNLLDLFIVTNLKDSEYGSLRWAIEQANQNRGKEDEIRFSFESGMINLNSPLLLFDTARTTIYGSGSIIVSGNNKTGIFWVNSEAFVTLDRLIIQDGNGSFGGVYNDGTLTVQGCTLRSNSTPEGGGVFNDVNGKLTVDHSTLQQNSSDRGGGIFNDGTLTLTGGSTLVANSASNGGGIFNSGMLTVDRSTFEVNSAGVHGGGIYNENDGSLTVTNSTLQQNSSDMGGGIFSRGRLTLQNSTLSFNSAVSGGGIFSGGVLRVSESTLSGNSAERGGGIFVAAGTVEDLRHSIVSGNEADWGREIASSIDLRSYGYNVLGFNGSSGLVGVTPIPTLDIIPTVPVAQILGPLVNNGGPTDTHALVAGSPAINAGFPNYSGPLTKDQRGFARVQGGRIDIGAFESNVQASRISFITDLFSDPEGDSGTTNRTVTRVQRDRSDTTVTVQLQLGGTASPGADYTAPSQPLTITFNPGETSKDIVIPIVGDTIVEPDETITLQLVNPGAGSILGSLTTTTYTILNDDIPAQNVGTLGNRALTFQGRLSSSDSVDRYQFTLGRDTNKFRLTLGDLSANADVFIHKVKDDGTLEPEPVKVSTNSSTRAEVINNLSLAAGTYIIEVKLVEDLFTNYNLSFRA